MKHFLLVTLAIAMALCSSATNAEKEFKRLIGKYDVADVVKKVELNHPAEFWKVMYDNNELTIQLLADLKRGKGAEKEAIKKFNSVQRFYPQYDKSVVESMQGFCDTLLIDMGIADSGVRCSLHVVNSDEINAFTALTEGGFAMCITTGLFIHKGMTYEILMGYVAHEFVHGVLFHHLRSFYAEAKELRKNKLLGGIEAGVAAVGEIANAYSSAVTGADYDTTSYGRKYDQIEENVKISTLKYTFAFSREEEVEADLIAFRFMQNLGRGEEFINGLRLLGSEYDNLYDEYSDHPAISSRIDFLKYVTQNPELGNTENDKIQKKRTKKVTEW